MELRPIDVLGTARMPGGSCRGRSWDRNCRGGARTWNRSGDAAVWVVLRSVQICF